MGLVIRGMAELGPVNITVSVYSSLSFLALSFSVLDLLFFLSYHFEDLLWVIFSGPQ